MVSSVSVKGADEVQRKLMALADITTRIERNCAGEICEVMRNDAVKHLNEPSGLRPKAAIDTGELKQSIETAPDKVSRTSPQTVSMGIETSCPHAIFIEYGTGPLGDPDVPHVDKMSWVYPTKGGGFKTAHSQPARPFMRPALYGNRDSFVKIIAGEIEKVFEE